MSDLQWGVRSRGGIVTKAPNEEKARLWATYDFKGRIGDVGEELVHFHADTQNVDWKEAA